MKYPHYPPPQGMYDPAFEHDACGIGFIADVEGRRSHATMRDGIQILINLTHRGAVGADREGGGGAGILMQVPVAFLRRRCSDIGSDLPERGSIRQNGISRSG